MTNPLDRLAQGIDIFRMVASSFSDERDAWEWIIARIEAHDRRRPPPLHPIVFTGSSSITFWHTLKQDMAPLVVMNRGFGGSRIHQVAFYARRIVIPYGPRAVVLFAGTNDIAGLKPKTPHQVLQGYRAFVGTIRAALPETPIYYVSITPTPSRWKLWSVVQEANRLICRETEGDPRLQYIDLTPTILGEDGTPRRDLFRIDRLHPNQKGYREWTRIIKPRLMADLLWQQHLAADGPRVSPYNDQSVSLSRREARRLRIRSS